MKVKDLVVDEIGVAPTCNVDRAKDILKISPRSTFKGFLGILLSPLKSKNGPGSDTPSSDAQRRHRAHLRSPTTASRIVFASIRAKDLTSSFSERPAGW